MKRIKRQYGFGLSPCYYCGQIATSIDHVIPHSIRQRLSEGIENPITALTITVPSCRECNSTLGARVYGNGTLKDRKEACKVHIRKKYKNFLKIPIWTENEIKELGPELEMYVRHGLILKQFVESRLRW